MILNKHFVQFYSPGTFMPEVSEKVVRSWNPKRATALARDIVERYGAKPFGFRFITRRCATPIDDGEGGKLNVEPKEIKRSGIYYIEGCIETIDQVMARNDPSEERLRDNMRINEIKKVVITKNGYRSVHPFNDGDNIVDKNGNVIG